MPSEPDLILRDMSDGVVVIDAKGRLKTINPAARALLELSDATLPDSFASLFIGDRRNDGFVQAMLDALQTTDAPGDCVTDFYTRSGQQRKVNVKATLTRADSGEKELIAVLSDVTERENAIVFRKDVTILVAIVFLFVCLYLFIYKLLDDCWPGMVAPSTLTYGLLFALLAVSVLIWKKTSMKPRITIRGPVARKAMASGAIVTVCAIVALIAVKLVMLRMGERPFCAGRAVLQPFSRYVERNLPLSSVRTRAGISCAQRLARGIHLCIRRKIRRARRAHLLAGLRRRTPALQLRHDGRRVADARRVGLLLSAKPQLFRRFPCALLRDGGGHDPRTAVTGGAP